MEAYKEYDHHQRKGIKIKKSLQVQPKQAVIFKKNS